MRRLIAALAVALIAPALATATAASAQAAPIDPAAAVKKQFKSSNGVKFSEVSKLVVSGRPFLAIHMKGAHQFGTFGVASSDVTFRVQLDKALRDAIKENEDGSESEIGSIDFLTKPTRVIDLKGKNYVSNPVLTETLPEGKTWVRSPRSQGMSAAGVSGQQVNVLEPRTLRALYATTARKSSGGRVDGTRTTLYSGKITVGELYKVSSSYRAKFGKPSAKQARSKVSWQLWVDGRNLPRRLFTVSIDKIGTETLKTAADTRFSSWGKGVFVKAPPAAQVIDAKDIDQEIPELPTELNTIK